jgi:hypothetical protein
MSENLSESQRKGGESQKRRRRPRHEPVVPVPERGFRRPARGVGVQEEEKEDWGRGHAIATGARAERHATGLADTRGLGVLLGAALGWRSVLAACAEAAAAAAVASGARGRGVRDGGEQEWRA